MALSDATAKVPDGRIECCTLDVSGLYFHHSATIDVKSGGRRAQCETCRAVYEFDGLYWKRARE